MMDDLDIDQLDVVGDLEEYKTNYADRCGNRTKSKHAQHLSSGVKRQVELIETWVHRHKEVYPDFPVEILHVEFTDTEGEVDEGDRRDNLDAILTLRLRDKTIVRRVEAECVGYRIPWARFKQRKIRRCLKKKAPIIHGQTNWNPARLFIFSVDDLFHIEKEGSYVRRDLYYRGTNLDNEGRPSVYDGKLYHLFNVDNTSCPWVDFSTLKPEMTYKKLIKNLLAAKGN